MELGNQGLAYAVIVTFFDRATPRTAQLCTERRLFKEVDDRRRESRWHILDQDILSGAVIDALRADGGGDDRNAALAGPPMYYRAKPRGRTLTSTETLSCELTIHTYPIRIQSDITHHSTQGGESNAEDGPVMAHLPLASTYPTL